MPVHAPHRNNHTHAERPTLPRLGFNEAWGRDLTGLAATAQSAGAKVARLNVIWSDFETAPGQYDEAKLQQLGDTIAALQAAGQKPVLVAMGAPAWASSNGGFVPDPQFDAAFGRFTGMIANRFQGAAAIEVWNEPNLEHYGNIPPERYAQILSAATAGIHEANPDMHVLSAGLSPVKKGAMAWDSYLKTVVQNATGDYAVAIHPYAYKGDAKELARKVEKQFDTAAKIAGKKNIWITEMGFSTGEMSQKKQAKALRDTFEMLDDKKRLQSVIVHRLMDDPNYVPDSSWEQGLGMISANGEEKKAFRMMRKIFG